MSTLCYMAIMSALPSLHTFAQLVSSYTCTQLLFHCLPVSIPVGSVYATYVLVYNIFDIEYKNTRPYYVTMCLWIVQLFRRPLNCNIIGIQCILVARNRWNNCSVYVNKSVKRSGFIVIRFHLLNGRVMGNAVNV